MRERRKKNPKTSRNLFFYLNTLVIPLSLLFLLRLLSRYNYQQSCSVHQQQQQQQKCNCIEKRKKIGNPHVRGGEKEVEKPCSHKQRQRERETERFRSLLFRLVSLSSNFSPPSMSTPGLFARGGPASCSTSLTSSMQQLPCSSRRRAAASSKQQRMRSMKRVAASNVFAAASSSIPAASSAAGSTFSFLSVPIPRGQARRATTSAPRRGRREVSKVS